MIPEYKLYHGAVLADIVDRTLFPLTIEELSEEGRLLNYVLNRSVGLQIKHATQRLHPWHFSFPQAHISTLQQMQAKYPETFLVLVCHTDGMVVANARDLLPSLTTLSSGQSWLRADRRKREMYRLYGALGEIHKRFGTTTESIVDALAGIKPRVERLG
jgi:hypothetical protein